MTDIAEQIADAQKRREESLLEIGGCSDGGCCIIRPRGQHTNGGCRCARYPENARNVERALRVNQIFAARIATIIGTVAR